MGQPLGFLPGMFSPPQPQFSMWWALPLAEDLLGCHPASWGGSAGSGCHHCRPLFLYRGAEGLGLLGH